MLTLDSAHSLHTYKRLNYNRQIVSAGVPVYFYKFKRNNF